MVFRRWNRCLLVTFLALNIPVQADAQEITCTMTQLPKNNENCRARLDCQYHIMFDLSSWACITQRNSYYYNGYSHQHRYDENYDLIVNIKNAESTLFVFTNEDSLKHFKQLTIYEGQLTYIPKEVFTLSKLTEIEISRNIIDAVKLYDFQPLIYLSKIILTNNKISFIDMDESSEVGVQNKMESIDLSYNIIKELPNNFLAVFPNLQHLNLSHNSISNVELLTFEGAAQLITLDISHNKLLEIGNAFGRLMYLQELSFENNNLTKLLTYNFITLTKLRKLNLRFNNINTIENDTFHNLLMLEYLDLGHNIIDTISKRMFESNTKLYYLSLLNNRINYIEADCFEGKSITEFNIESNRLTGVIEKNTFKGVHVNELNLSGENITSVGDEAFTGMSSLNLLNLSMNAINNLSSLAFSSLESLSILDMSYNQLKELNFDSNSLRNLTVLNVQHNKIERINQTVFKNFISLTELDLSHNVIKGIAPQLFSELKKIEVLKLSHSEFVNILKGRALEGLLSLRRIEMSATRTTFFQNESFTGLTSLSYLNSSFGQLAGIGYNAFFETGNIEILDLSHNLLDTFHINTTTIENIQEIDLNDNAIRNITNETFFNLAILRNLKLSNNDIINLNAYSFLYLKSLLYLDISSNVEINIIDNPFDSLRQLSSLSLRNIKTRFSFENSSASIEDLDLRACAIFEVSKVFLFKVSNIHYLNLNRNVITKIDKSSFQIMPSLVRLDLSSNKITYIQPGSFLHTNKLTVLNLNGNNIASFQFGVFDGLHLLRNLNLSNNLIESFDIKLLPAISSLSLDNNVISDLNFKDIFDKDISTLSIGGNQISCKVLAELKSKSFKKFNDKITAGTLDYHSENVNGISCQSISNYIPRDLPVASNSSIDISPLIILLKNAVQKFDLALQTISENSNKTNELKNEVNKNTKLFEDFFDSNGKSQKTTNEYFAKLVDINNASYLEQRDIKKILRNQTVIKKNEKQYNATSKIQAVDEQNIRSEVKALLKIETDALREEFRNTLASVLKGESQEALVSPKATTDTNPVFYFIAVCLAISLTVYVANLAVHCWLKRSLRSPQDEHSSVRHIVNSMEME